MPTRKPVFRTTEPQARKVKDEINKRQAAKKKKAKDTGGKTTAKTPKGVQKSKAQGKKELEAIRKKRAMKKKVVKKKKK